MRWRRGKEEVVVYKRLASGSDCTEDRVPRGHVPVIVGRDDAEAERFVVHVRVFKDPCIVMLLDMAANEFGNHQPGVLRIPCDVDRFRRIIEVIYKPR